jgi:mannose-6-phosphate isomerase-like protein (cupin superfamily)
MTTTIRSVDQIQPMMIPTHGPRHQVRKMYEMRDLGVFHSTMLVGCELPHEVHQCDEVILRLRGNATIKVDERVHASGAEVASVIPAGTWHQSTSTEANDSVEQIVLLAYSQAEGSILDAVLDVIAVD